MTITLQHLPHQLHPIPTVLGSIPFFPILHWILLVPAVVNLIKRTQRTKITPFDPLIQQHGLVEMQCVLLSNLVCRHDPLLKLLSKPIKL